ncbi:MAG: hypothetical protein EGQ14_06465 [Spirochaetia bacterium]|nr:hypothetical protein [Spirochaetia bacterium]
MGKTALYTHFYTADTSGVYPALIVKILTKKKNKTTLLKRTTPHPIGRIAFFPLLTSRATLFL